MQNNSGVAIAYQPWRASDFSRHGKLLLQIRAFFAKITALLYGLLHKDVKCIGDPSIQKHVCIEKSAVFSTGFMST